MASFRSSVTVASGAAANGDYPSSEGVSVEGGKYNVFVPGTFNGATITLYLARETGDFIALTEGAFSAPTADFELNAPRDARVKATVTNAGSPSPNIDVYLDPIPNEGRWGM